MGRVQCAEFCCGLFEAANVQAKGSDFYTVLSRERNSTFPLSVQFVPAVREDHLPIGLAGLTRNNASVRSQEKSNTGNHGTSPWNRPWFGE